MRVSLVQQLTKPRTKLQKVTTLVEDRGADKIN